MPLISPLTPNSLLRQIVDRLQVVLAEPPPLTGFNNRDLFILRHAQNIHSLLNSYLLLEPHETHFTAARILIRPTLESFFSLCAAAKDADFVGKRVVGELHD